MLPALVLEIPGGDVVRDGVAGDAGERVLRADVARERPDNDRELSLPVDARGRRRQQDLVVGPDHRRRRLQEEHGLGGRRPAALAGVRAVVARDGDDLARRRDGRPQAHPPARLDHSGAQQIGGVVTIDGVRRELERCACDREGRGSASQEGMHLGGEQRIGFGLRSSDVFAGQSDRERAVEIDDRPGVRTGGQHGPESAHARARRFQRFEAERRIGERGGPAPGVGSSRKRCRPRGARS